MLATTASTRAFTSRRRSTQSPARIDCAKMQPHPSFSTGCCRFGDASYIIVTFESRALYHVFAMQDVGPGRSLDSSCCGAIFGSRAATCSGAVDVSQIHLGTVEVN